VSEPLFNVGMVCKDHAPQPGKFAGMNPETFLGKFVKLGFDAINPRSGKETKEHMWVKVTHMADGFLAGTLENDPILICEYQNGDGVLFQVEEIEDIIAEGAS